MIPVNPVNIPVLLLYLNAPFCHRPLALNARYAYRILDLYSLLALNVYVPFPYDASITAVVELLASAGGKENAHGPRVGVGVGVTVGVFVGVAVGVSVGTGVGVTVGVLVGAAVGVPGPGVSVGVGVLVGVGVGVLVTDGSTSGTGVGVVAGGMTSVADPGGLNTLRSLI